MSEIRKSVCIRIIDSDQIVEDISFRSIVPLDNEKDEINTQSNVSSSSSPYPSSVQQERRMTRERTSGLAGKGATLKAHTHTRFDGSPDKQWKEHGSASATTSSGMAPKKARECTQREMAIVNSSTPAKHQNSNYERTQREEAIVNNNSIPAKRQKTNERAQREMPILISSTLAKHQKSNERTHIEMAMIFSSTPAKHQKSNYRHTLSEISTNSSHSQLHGNATSSRGRSFSKYSSIVAESSPANPSPPGKFFMMETSPAKRKENDERRVPIREEVSMTTTVGSSRRLSKYDASVTKKLESNYYHERRQNEISRSRSGNRTDALSLANSLQEENENDGERKTTHACQCECKNSSGDYDYDVLEMEKGEGKSSNWHVRDRDSRRGGRRPSQDQDGGGISWRINDEQNILSFLGRRTALFRPSTQLWVEDEVLKIYMEAKRRDRETPSFHHHKIESQNAAFLHETDSQNATFQYGTDSQNATFLYETDSQNATFLKGRESQNATVLYGTDSRNATFQYETDSQNATFLKKRESEHQNATVLYDTESKHIIITDPLETE